MSKQFFSLVARIRPFHHIYIQMIAFEGRISANCTKDLANPGWNQISPRFLQIVQQKKKEKREKGKRWSGSINNSWTVPLRVLRGPCDPWCNTPDRKENYYNSHRRIAFPRVWEVTQGATNNPNYRQQWRLNYRTIPSFAYWPTGARSRRVCCWLIFAPPNVGRRSLSPTNERTVIDEMPKWTGANSPESSE